jgi:uncharacterized membrane-anchored protein
VTRWLRIALLAQVAFFAVWGGRLLTSHTDAAVVWLATEPVDPRDLLSGHYVALRYAMGTADGAHCPQELRESAPRAVWVELILGTETALTAEGVTTLWEPVQCLAEPPPSAGVWVLGNLDADGNIAYGIERMFVAEASALREARSGSVVAKIGVNDGHEPRILGLVVKHAPTDTPTDE